MYTLGQTTTRKAVKYEDNCIAISCEAGADLDDFTVVRFDASDSTVKPMSATDQEMFGILRVGGKSGEQVTVDTPFSHLLRCQCNDTIAIGAKVQVMGYNATDKYNVVDTVGLGLPTHGIALEAGVEDGIITVGFFRTPQLLILD